MNVKMVAAGACLVLFLLPMAQASVPILPMPSQSVPECDPNAGLQIDCEYGFPWLCLVYLRGCWVIDPNCKDGSGISEIDC